MMKVLIIDDESAMHTVMTQMLSRIDGVKDVHCFSSSASALIFMQTHEADIAFVDIELGTENGLQIAAALRKLSGRMEIVFVTSHKEYALASFDMYPLDYIVKPISRSRLEATLARAMTRVTAGEQAVGMEAEAPVPRLYVRTLGGFSVSNAQGERLRWISRKSAELCAFLLLHHGQFVHRLRVMDCLFADMPAKNAGIYLNTVVYQLRKVFASYDLKEAVEVLNEQYRLDVSAMALDFIDFEQQVLAWEPTARDAVESGLAIEKNYGGELFAEYAFPWAAAAAHRMEQVYLPFAKRLSRVMSEQQAYHEASGVLRRILQISELDEEANLLLLEVLYKQRDWPALKRHIDSYRQLYEQELGLPLPPQASRWTDY